ncbi:MAG: hypothetical protein M3417_05680 [Actinomycetota bacterium]|nr:hypothetical protein [Actinomycetota bacterium]
MPHLQLKDIPAGIHDALREQAKYHGISMREYVLRLIEADVGKKDTWEETFVMLRTGPKPSAAPDIVEIIRQGREEREEQILDAVLQPR